MSSEQQQKYIEKIIEAKRVKRMQRTLKKMRKFGDKYQCSECFHRKTKSCTDDLPNGCENYFNAKTGLIFND